MTLTRKDFEAIASGFRNSFDLDMLQDVKGHPERENLAFVGIEHAIMSVANVLAESNPRFDRMKFFEACFPN